MPSPSATAYIEETSNLLLEAFRHFGTEAGQVLSYSKLFPYLDSKAAHYRDWLRDAEHVLRDKSYTTPDPAGLMLTEVGHQAIHNKNS